MIYWFTTKKGQHSQQYLKFINPTKSVVCWCLLVSFNHNPISEKFHALRNRPWLFESCKVLGHVLFSQRHFSLSHNDGISWCHRWVFHAKFRMLKPWLGRTVAWSNVASHEVTWTSLGLVLGWYQNEKSNANMIEPSKLIVESLLQNIGTPIPHSSRL